MALVLDDHLLLDLLADRAGPWLSSTVAGSAVYTTASWYYRLASAAEHGSGTGALSGRISALPGAQQRRLRSRISDLPDLVGLIGPRKLVPVMARLHPPRRLNYLSAEGLALAILTEAAIAVRFDSPPLREACDALHVEYRLAAQG